jgi:putative nucleotidyltransferase with HDIG domain
LADGERRSVSGERILVVDDEAVVRELTQEILGEEKYETSAASSGAEALEKLSGHRFDLILTDVKMPAMDGLSFLREASLLQRGMAAVVMTGHGSMDLVIDAIRSGASGFVLKPFTRQELLLVIQEAFKKQALIRENIRLKSLLPLIEIGRSLLSETREETILERAVRIARDEAAADRVSIMLEEPGEDVLLIRASVGLPDTIARSTRMKLGEGISGRVALGPGGVLLNGEDATPPELRRLMRDGQLGSAICLPFILPVSATRGVLNVGRLRGGPKFARSDVEMLGIVCAQMAAAIANTRLYSAIVEKSRELEESQFDSIKSLAQAIEAKDDYTGGHCDRLIDFALEMARELGLMADETDHLKYAAALHDIGKIGISETILNKPARLTPAEYEVMKNHVRKGAEILSQVKFLSPVVPLIYHHQEWFDGSGYPDGLLGDAIPLGARIVAVLDTFDAMTTDRPYRKALPISTALAEMRRQSGRQFDPRVVAAFEKVLSRKEGDLSERVTS